ncbi:MAG: biotin carboxylase N-terminal domain-containing protein, partial [Candidatus Puniceispirillaceae bacterium]
MFKKILIANRGDVALRVLRACQELKIPNVVVHSTADADSMPVRLADESVCIGPPSSADSYLNVASIITAAGITGADAVHPGVGFLAENAEFAEIVAAHGLTFIGPEPRHIRSMGDKVEAKITAAEAGLPLVPGSPGAVPTLEEARRIGADVGYPLLVKAASGGGGRGMKVAETEAN